MKSLPAGNAPLPIKIPHFPNALYAVIWRNWDLIDLHKLATVLRGTPEAIAELALSMGLPVQRDIPDGELRRNYMTVIRRNWHLLPYEQLCDLLGWDAETMQFYLNEDDFMWIKLGGYKPHCPPVYYCTPDGATRARAREIRRVVESHFGNTLAGAAEPPFGFIERFKTNDRQSSPPANRASGLAMLYPYFLRYGDPLIGEGIDDIPEGYLATIAASGINAIWIQAVLNKLAPWALAPELSDGYEERLENLKKLVHRCRAHGISVLLYLNEPRAMPQAFFEKWPELRGAQETPSRAKYSPKLAALCTSTPEVQAFLVNSVRHVFEAVPDLGGVFAITFSENLTNCYSRVYAEEQCPRCVKRGAAAIHGEVCSLLERGMREAGSKGRFLFYAWSTPEEWLPEIISGLPERSSVLTVSEWGTPFTRGDYRGTVNEYSISVVGPSAQSQKQWAVAKEYGLETIAKIPGANTWEISSVPYVPALRLVGEHLSNLTSIGIDGVMIGWTCGGSPSPNLDLMNELIRKPGGDVAGALLTVAERLHGATVAPKVVAAWDLMSDAFEEFPFDISVCYTGPQSMGPANLLFLKPSGFKATTVTFPFDDLETWRGPYTPETLLQQFETLAQRWQHGVDLLAELREAHHTAALDDEWRIAEAALIHFRSTAQQIRLLMIRDSGSKEVAEILRAEIALAQRLFKLVQEDSRIGFEATNHYGYTRFDLVEKVINCQQLLTEAGL